MPRGTRSKPTADAFAIIEQGGDSKAKWVRIGPVWTNQDGSQTMVMESEPIEWQSARCERRVQIRKRERRGSGGRDRDDE